MVINFITNWLRYYIAIMFCMCIDNYFWIPADRKWFYTKEWKPHFKPLLIIRGREYFLMPKTKQGWNIIKNRIKDVTTHLYDIIPAIITSFILAIIFGI